MRGPEIRDLSIGQAPLRSLDRRTPSEHRDALDPAQGQPHLLRDPFRDWVVLFYDGGDGEGQCTVVTETRGPLEGQRVVRGREREGGRAVDA